MSRQRGSSSPSRTSVRIGVAPVLAALLAVAGCDDGPLSTSGAAPGPARVALSPSFSAAAGIEDALARAFDRINEYHLTFSRIPSGDVALDTIVPVEPGAATHELDIAVPLLELSERLSLELRAVERTPDGVVVVLFSAVSEVEATAGQVARSASAVELEYSGPGAGATEIGVEPRGRTLVPGASAPFSSTVLDEAGTAIEGVPLAWEAEDPSVASVSPDGVVTAGSPGSTRVTATTPTGLSASAPLHVVDGVLAYAADGGVVVSALDGSGRDEVASAGSDPAWLPGGAGVVYASGAGIRGPDGSALLAGAASPAVSPDGVHVAGASGGSLAYATLAGGHAAEGPAGRHPVWVDAGHLVVDGGSIERIAADGSERETLSAVEGDRWPVVVGDGRIGFVSERDGEAAVWTVDRDGSGAARITPDGMAVASRPAFSPDGRFAVVSAAYDGDSGFFLLPTDGSTPPSLLPLDSGGDPAWRPDGGDVAPPAVSVEEIDPSRPAAGQEVTLAGSGFDWIVPAANAVEIPLRDGSAAEAEVVAVTPGTLTFVAPAMMMEGALTVRTSISEGTLALAPATGDVEVVAETSTGKRVDGIDVEAVHADGWSAGVVTTDGDGVALFEDLLVGTYDLSFSPRAGYEVSAPADPVPVTLDATTTVRPEVAAIPSEITVESSSLSFTEPGSGMIKVAAYDVDGDPVPAELSFESTATAIATARRVDETTVEIVAKAPGNATVTIVAEVPSTATAGAAAGAAGGPSGSSHGGSARIDVDVTVNGTVAGEMVDASGTPVPGIPVALLEHGQVRLERASGGDGRFAFPDLDPGPYQLRVAPPSPYTVQGDAVRDIVLNAVNPAPFETFVVGAGTGGLAGNVFDAATGSPVSGASVLVFPEGSGQSAASVVTDASGGYEASGLPTGDYRIQVEADGYEIATAGATVLADQVVTVSPIGLQAESGPGNVEGTIRDATNNAAVSGATVELRAGAGAPDSDPPVATTTADGSGFYAFDQVPSGNYTLRAVSSGYADGHADVVVIAGETVSRSVLLSPQLAEGEMRIVLTWGPSNIPNVPPDLDSHLTGPDGSGGRFHIAYYSRGSLNASPFAYLHNDDTSWEGPETTTITQQRPGVYRFSVYRFCCSSDLLRLSQARVQVFDATGEVASFSVPNRDGTVWNVFELENGAIRAVNTMNGPYDPPSASASTGAGAGAGSGPPALDALPPKEGPSEELVVPVTGRKERPRR